MCVKGLWSPYFQPLPGFAVFLHPLGIRARGTDFAGKISTEVFSEFASFSSAIIFIHSYGLKELTEISGESLFVFSFIYYSCEQTAALMGY